MPATKPPPAKTPPPSRNSPKSTTASTNPSASSNASSSISSSRTTGSCAATASSPPTSSTKPLGSPTHPKWGQISARASPPIPTPSSASTVTSSKPSAPNFTHLAELERRQALRRQHQPDADPPVTDSPETQNSPIGFVPQPTSTSTSTPIVGQVARGTPWVQRVGNPPLRNPPLRNPPLSPVPAAAPRYTVISDSSSPLRPWLK